MKIAFFYENKEFTAECNMMTARETVSINGTVVCEKRNFFNFTSLHRFRYEGKQYELNLKLRLLQGLVNAMLLKDGQTVYEQDFTMRGKAVTVKKVIMPKWSYIFITLCIIIPFVSLGGAIPALLGIGGACVCATISRKSTIPTPFKIILCTLITIISWFLFLILITLLRSAKKA